MRSLALIAVLAASPAAFASTDAEQAQAAERLAARAQDALDAILGPGRSKVEIDVAGDHSEINSDTEFLFPMDKGSAAARAAAHLLDLPGYVKDKAAGPPAPKPDAEPPPSESYQKQQEASRHDGGFQIRSIHATVVLDSRLDDAAVREASQLLPSLLTLDMTRGDTLSILRAPLRPAWKSAFATPGDWRSAAYALGGGLIALAAALIAFAGLVLAGRALGRSLGRELASRPRAEPAAAPVEVEALPELSPGSAGFLEGGASAAGAAGGAPLLGRRFDFLAGRDPELIARAVAAEKPEELSLFFGHLAESIPDLASRLFAHLSPDVQAEVSRSLLKLSVADPERLTALEDRLRRAVENGVLGPQSLGRILSRVPGDARADLLGRLPAGDAEEIERHVFSFEDLERLAAAPLRRLLRAVPYETWGPALRGAPRALVEAVLLDLPAGPRELVRAAAGAPQPREKIDEARSRILDAFAALEAKGELAVGEKNGDLV
ncbi:MAG TPA: FliG C-terminal domain-containing protein [Elusimicrobiota bacterium]|jgi:hypothetical protein|nr:FliG C-terminal domain-containing protein [Elusimicrobiota bacterium]